MIVTMKAGQNWRADEPKVVARSRASRERWSVVPGRPWQIRLLDNFELVRASGEVTLSARKAVALLAYLGLQRNRRASRGVLASLLWENAASTGQARASLRQTIATVRRVEGGDPAIIVCDGDFLCLSPAVEVDARRFERLAAGDHADRRMAVELYRTDLLNGFALRDAVGFNEWLVIEQARLRNKVVALLTSLVEDAVAQGGDWNVGVADALHLLSVDPLNEIGHRALMWLYARQGRSSLAITQYRTLSDLLRQELGISPEAQTVQLHQLLLGRRRSLPVRSRRPLAATGPVAVSPGEHSNGLSPIAGGSAVVAQGQHSGRHFDVAPPGIFAGTPSSIATGFG